MTTHVLSFDREGMVRSLNAQFTSSSTFLGELLQNARRAGARKIHIEWKPERRQLIVQDDGHGIRNFEALLTGGKSDWQKDVLLRDRPFGVGFMAAILAAEAVTIRSHHQECHFLSRTLLNFEPVEVKTSDSPFCGTEVTLVLRAEHPLISGSRTIPCPATLASLLKRLVSGFPLPVLFQHEELPRPHAIGGPLRFQHSDIGDVFLNGWEECQPDHPYPQACLYYQGIPICVDMTLDTSNVVHLDTNAFSARMPDRDTLIDAPDAKERIRARIRQLWRHRLIECYASLSRQTFVDLHWEHCLDYGLKELLVEAPLTAAMVRRYAQPVHLVESEEVFEEWPKEAPLPGPEALFVTDLRNDYCGGADDPPAPLASLYALVRQLPELDDRLPEGHWAVARRIDLLDPELGIEYEILNPGRTAEYVGEIIDCTVQVCDSIVIRFRPSVLCRIPQALRELLTEQIVTHRAFYDAGKELLIVPAQAHWIEPAVWQISSFTVDDVFQDSDFQRDIDGVVQVIEGLRAESPTTYLQALLRVVRPDATLLGTGPFLVTYDDHADMFKVETPAT